ncbi:MAG: enoyl-[acyl-carrier-protein] reductase FabK [Firmicutes bacterium]|nr:enoyl-[acyl-carrier-protein] reductase FabK [Bacillota bacterium]
MLRTALCDLLGIRHPVIQGGMAWVSEARLAAAVSEAGGLGVIGTGNAPPDWVREQVRRVRELTDRPFGVNVMLRSPFAEEVIRVLWEERVPVVTTGAGNPGKYVEEFRRRGTRVLPVVSSVALAQRLERAGVDAVIAEGLESGGHVGEITTMALVPQVVDAIKIPVVAAGGIFDGRGLVAALALGAVGVQMGTRFMSAEECQIHPRVKEFLIRARDRDTVVTGRTTGHPVRVLRNKLAREFELLEGRGASVEELEALGTGRLRAAMVDGDVEYGSVMAGQVAAMVKRVQPAREIVEEVVAEAAALLRRLPGLVETA